MDSNLNCSYEDLQYDEACLILNNQADVSNLWLYTLSSDCVECPYSRNVKFKDEKSINVINTARSQFWRVIETNGDEEYISASDASGLYCEINPNIGQFGSYELIVNRNNSCTLREINEPTNVYFSLAIACGFIVFLLIGLSFFKWMRSVIKKRCSRTEREEEPENIKTRIRRVRSLDTVRGMSILLMIFVNDGAAGYWILEHATWDGLYIGDLVFPCFMWIMGVCIPLSISSQISRGTPRLSVCYTIVKRSIYLFFIGVSLNTLGGNIQLENIRLFGVLQRFSISYFVVALVYAILYFPCPERLKRSSIRDVLILLPQWIIALAILASHCVITFMLSVPDCPKAYLGPGGRHADSKYLNCIGGAAGYVDRLLLGVNHIYQSPTANSVYGSGPFDPEGILGSLTSIFQVFLGVQAGQILREYKTSKSRLFRWLFWSLILGSVGFALHYINIVPINKNLWSISFVSVTTSISLVLLCICYILIDAAALWEGGPFRIPGMNALVMYVGHQVFYQMFPFHWKIGKMETHGWLLGESLWCVAVWVCIAYILHRKKIYVTL